MSVLRVVPKLPLNNGKSVFPFMPRTNSIESIALINQMLTSVFNSFLYVQFLQSSETDEKRRHYSIKEYLQTFIVNRISDVVTVSMEDDPNLISSIPIQMTDFFNGKMLDGSVIKPMTNFVTRSDKSAQGKENPIYGYDDMVFIRNGRPCVLAFRLGEGCNDVDKTIKDIAIKRSVRWIAENIDELSDNIDGLNTVDIFRHYFDCHTKSMSVDRFAFTSEGVMHEHTPIKIWDLWKDSALGFCGGAE